MPNNKLIIGIAVVVFLAALGGIIYFGQTPSQNGNLFMNQNGKYSFNPAPWKASTNRYNSENSLFGPDANSSSGLGRVEVFSGQASIDSFLQGIAAQFSGRASTTVDGIPGIRIRYNSTISGEEVVLLKDGKIYNIYVNSQKSEDINLFNQIISTFKFLGNKAASPNQKIEYRNNRYGFSFSLPQNWKGYLISTNTWEGETGGASGDILVEQGPIISIRNPKWTAQNRYQDIPVMIFTSAQWNSLLQGDYHIGAAPINPSELGRNSKYVFALPARYNYAFPAGWEEVQSILDKHPLKAF